MALVTYGGPERLNFLFRFSLQVLHILCVLAFQICGYSSECGLLDAGLFRRPESKFCSKNSLKIFSLMVTERAILTLKYVVS